MTRSIFFLVEADYALKYVDTNYTLDVVNDLGVSKDALANQYKYTQDIVTDSKGALKGASWQACPAGMIYRRDIAKKKYSRQMILRRFRSCSKIGILSRQHLRS